MFMGFDAYRLGFSMISYALLVIFSFLIAVSYTGPVYLAFRTVQLEKNDASNQGADGELENSSLPQKVEGIGDFAPWCVVVGTGALAFSFA